jgi:hypothetical protein
LNAACVALFACALAGCAATTTLDAAQGGTTIAIKKSSHSFAPRTERFATTSFGNYEFSPSRLVSSPSRAYFR